MWDGRIDDDDDDDAFLRYVCTLTCVSFVERLLLAEYEAIVVLRSDGFGLFVRARCVVK